MTSYDAGVLFEREGDTPIGPEVGRLVEDGRVVEFIDGERVRIEDGDYVDPIGRHCESWDHAGLIALNRGLVARSERRMRMLAKEA